MNLNEAYSILELSPDASEDEVKKRFKELSKKWHPDKNINNPEAEPKFKEINSAYQRITSPTERERYQDMPQSDFDFGGGNPFGGFGFSNPFQRQRHAPPIQVNITISFAESILGCKKDIKINRNIKCSSCNGQGATKVNTGCKKCGGKGQVIVQQGNMMFVSQCECSARQNVKKCTDCSNGVVSSESSINVHIPGGVQNGNVLRLNGMGNYAGSIANMDQYSDAFLSPLIIEDDELKLEDEFVVSHLNISLLEALKGTSKTVKTVVGEKEIQIKSLSKNKEEVIIPHVGVNGVGSQKVILNVNYPNNIDNLIKSLE